MENPDKSFQEMCNYIIKKIYKLFIKIINKFGKPIGYTIIGVMSIGIFLMFIMTLILIGAKVVYNMIIFYLKMLKS